MKLPYLMTLICIIGLIILLSNRIGFYEKECIKLETGVTGYKKVIDGKDYFCDQDACREITVKSEVIDCEI